MEIPAAALPPRDAYALLTSFVIPRPIAWVSTMEAGGHVNLAPFSYFQGLCSDPPMVTLAISDRRGGAPKDTLRIARATGVLCINMVEEADAERMNATSADFAPEVSEATTCGIATRPCVAIAGVRIASARAALECKLVDVHRYGRRAAVNLAVCEVVHAYIDDGLTVDGRPLVDAEGVRPLARLGGERYAALGARRSIARPAAPETTNR